MVNVKSIRMSAFNYAKWFGKKTGQFDEKRVDRAFSYLQSGLCHAKWHEYQTTLRSCNCTDATGVVVRNGMAYDVKAPNPYCKHRLALMIEKKMDELRNKEMTT